MAMLRFRVAEDSMRPALLPGSEFVATESRQARVGDLVALPHPERDDFWLVKRRVDPPQPLPDGLAWVSSDNSTVNGVDSRSFGPVPVEALRPVVEQLDSTTFGEAVDLLTAEDPALAAIVEEHGSPRFWRRQPGFPTLVLFILEQQVSLESGAAVFRRISQAAGSVQPGNLLALGEDGLRAAGTTRQKAGYLIGLAEAVFSSALDLGELERAPSNRARDVLLGIKGVGPWTADVYLLSALRHVDVLPVGDRALQVGAAETLGLATIPGSSDLELLAEPWRPLRSVAARLIWHGYLARRGRTEPDHPVTSPGGEA
jgi:DNA-3-methyladenine glycosylase II